MSLSARFFIRADLHARLCGTLRQHPHHSPLMEPLSAVLPLTEVGGRHTALERALELKPSNSHEFGGTIAALIFARNRS